MQSYVRVPLGIQSDRYENIAAYRRDNSDDRGPVAIWLVTVKSAGFHGIEGRQGQELCRRVQRISDSWNDHNRNME